MFFSRDNLIVLGILAVIAITYFAVVYRPQSASAENISARTTEVKHLLESDVVQASRIPPMLREIEQMKHRYNDKDWGRRLPERQELAGFLSEIASGLSQEKLTIHLVQPGNPSQNPRYNCLPITLKFEGDFISLARFLKQIDGMTRLTRIERLMIQSDEGMKNIEVEMGMNIYFTEQSRRMSGKIEQAGDEQ